MKKKSIISLLLVLALVLSCFAGCAGKSDDAEEPEQESSQQEESTELTKIRISAINTPTWAPVFIAKTEGFFEEEGLDVEFVTPGGPKGFQAMHAGDCEFSMLSQEPLLIAQEQGMESSIVAAMLKTRIYGFVTPKDITDISQLKGKTIFGSDPGSAPYVFTCEVLKKGGLDPETDVTFISTSDQAAGLQALMAGEIDGAFINMSNVPMLGDFEYNVLVDTTDSAQSVEYLGSADFPGEMICCTKKYAEEHPEDVQKAVNAIIKAEEWIDSHSDEEVAASLSAEFGDVDPAVLAEEVKYIRKQLKTDGMISEEGQKAVVDMLIKAGVIQTEIPYDAVVDMTFAKNYAESK